MHTQTSGPAGAQALITNLYFDADVLNEPLAGVDLQAQSANIDAPTTRGTRASEETLIFDSLNASVIARNVKATATTTAEGAQSISEVRDMEIWLYGRKIVTLDYAASYVITHKQRLSRSHVDMHALYAGGLPLDPEGHRSVEMKVSIAGLENTKVKVHAVREHNKERGLIQAVTLRFSLSGENPEGAHFKVPLGTVTVAQVEARSQEPVWAGGIPAQRAPQMSEALIA